MFFETPIIVSTDTILEKKVKQYNTGYSVDALDDEAIIRLVNTITVEQYEQFRNSLKTIDKKESVNDNTEFLCKLKTEFGI